MNSLWRSTSELNTTQYYDIDLETEIVRYGLDPFESEHRKAHSVVDSREMNDLIEEIKKERTAKNTSAKILSKFRFLWDN